MRDETKHYYQFSFDPVPDSEGAKRVSFFSAPYKNVQNLTNQTQNIYKTSDIEKNLNLLSYNLQGTPDRLICFYLIAFEKVDNIKSWTFFRNNADGAE